MLVVVMVVMVVGGDVRVVMMVVLVVDGDVRVVMMVVMVVGGDVRVVTMVVSLFHSHSITVFSACLIPSSQSFILFLVSSFRYHMYASFE